MLGALEIQVQSLYEVEITLKRKYRFAKNFHTSQVILKQMNNFFSSSMPWVSSAVDVDGENMLYHQLKMYFSNQNK